MTKSTSLSGQSPKLRRLLGWGCLLLIIVLWSIPGDVLMLVATQSDVLLGRYSLERFSFLAIVSPLIVALGALLLSGVQFDRKFAFRAIALGVSTALGLIMVVIVDFATHPMRAPRYIEEAVPSEKIPDGIETLRTGRRRQPSAHFEYTFLDEPTTKRTYPNPPPGYPEFEITVTSDERGFRNSSELESYDIVTLGDSFAEGASVSDGQEWPVLLGEKTGLSVYNMGISGGNPRNYWNNFLMYRDAIKPKAVVLLLYEGNDFKGERGVRKDETSFFDFLTTPDRLALVRNAKRLSLEVFAPMNSNGPIPGIENLSWMPVAIEKDGATNYYGFRPKRMLRLDLSPDEFRETHGWKHVESILSAMNRVCTNEGIQFIVVHGPSKPHVVLPLIRERLSSEDLHRFASFREGDLPSPEAFEDRLYQQIETEESVVREFCESEGIGFISVTDALRREMSEGVQVYYTYDQHWTPLGHDVVADTVAEYFDRPADRHE